MSFLLRSLLGSILFFALLPSDAIAQEQEPIAITSKERIAYDDLPEAVKKEFQTSPYELKERKGVYKVEAQDGETLYRIDLILLDKEKDRRLHYDPEGTLMGNRLYAE